MQRVHAWLSREQGGACDRLFGGYSSPGKSIMPSRLEYGNGLHHRLQRQPSAHDQRTAGNGGDEGDACDTDDDNGGMPDAFETENGLNPFNPADASKDLDGDGFTNLQESETGTDTNDPASNPATVFLPILQMLFEE